MRGEKLSNDSESAEDFSRYLKEKIASENLILDNIYNADESGIYWRTIVSCTLSQKIEEDVSGRKEKKDRLTALFCSNASGRNRIPLLLIGKSNIPLCLRNLVSKEKKGNCLKKLDCLGVVYTNQKSAWMSQHIFQCW